MWGTAKRLIQTRLGQGALNLIKHSLLLREVLQHDKIIICGFLGIKLYKGKLNKEAHPGIYLVV